MPLDASILKAVITATTVSVRRLEKTRDRLPRQKLQYCMRTTGLAERNVRVCRTCLRTRKQWEGVR